MNQPVPNIVSSELMVTGGEHARTRKLVVLTLIRRDYALLEQMLHAAQQKLPDLTMDGMLSALVTEACRIRREEMASTREGDYQP